MGNQNPLPTDEQAKAEIEQIVEDERPTIWEMDQVYAVQFSQELIKSRPPKALARARRFRKSLEEHNKKEDKESAEAQKRRDALSKKPLYSSGEPGFLDSLFRSFLAGLNGTPGSWLNWMELNDKSLTVYTPFTSVTERKITQKDLDDKRFELGVNPPVYFDGILGQLRSFGIQNLWTPWGKVKIRTPWGQIVVREPGSGKELAAVVALWPNDKLDAFRKGLQQIYRAEHPFDKHKRLPKLSDLFNLYIDEWERFSPKPGHPAILSMELPGTTAGKDYTFALQVIGDPPPTFQLLEKPEGMEINSATGVLRWNVPKEGNHQVQVEAKNEIGIDVENYTLKVDKPADAKPASKGWFSNFWSGSCLFLLIALAIILLALVLQPFLI